LQIESGNIATAVSSLLWALNYTQQSAATAAAAAAVLPYSAQQHDLPPLLQQHISTAPAPLRALLWHTALHALVYTAFPGASLPLASAASADSLTGYEKLRWRLDPHVPALCAPVRMLLTDSALLSTVRAVFTAAVRELSTPELLATSDSPTAADAAAVVVGQTGNDSSGTSSSSDSSHYSSECELLCLNWQQLEQCVTVLKGDSSDTALLPLLHALGTPINSNGSGSGSSNSSTAVSDAAAVVAAVVSVGKRMPELLLQSLQYCTEEYRSAVAAALASTLQEQQQHEQRSDVQLLACLLVAESGYSSDQTAATATAAVTTGKTGNELLKHYWPSMEHVWEGLHRYHTLLHTIHYAIYNVQHTLL
jgi:hypothetical protein